MGLTFASDQGVVDAVGHALDPALPQDTNYETYIVDRTAPSLTSITRWDPAAEFTNLNGVVFRLTFSEAVQSVGRQDIDVVIGEGDNISLLPAGRYVIATVGTDGTTYNLTLPANFNNRVSLRMDAENNDIRDLAGNSLPAAAMPTGANESYIVDHVGPRVSLARADGADSKLNGPFDVTVTFTERNGLAESGAGAFAVGDLQVANGSATSVTVTSNPLVWTAKITPDVNFDRQCHGIPSGGTRYGRRGAMATPPRKSSTCRSTPSGRPLC